MASNNKSILAAKEAEIETIKKSLVESQASVIVATRGLTVEQDTKLRVALRKEGVEFAVRKNSLCKKAVEGSDMAGLAPLFEGPTAVATSKNDVCAAAKVLTKFAKEYEPLTIKGGFCDGEVLDVAGVEKLAKVPGREQLLSMLLSALTGNIRGFAVAVKAVAEQKEQQA